MEERDDHHDLGTEVLQREVYHLDAHALGHLREILSGNLDPGLTVLDQDVAAARITTKVVAEPFSQTVIPRDIHFNVVVKELANVCLAVWGDHGGLPAVGPEYDPQ